MPVDHTEKGFELAVESHLLAHGYTKGDLGGFDPRLALDPGTLVRLLRHTQPQEWEKLAVFSARLMQIFRTRKHLVFQGFARLGGVFRPPQTRYEIAKASRNADFLGKLWNSGPEKLHQSSSEAIREARWESPEAVDSK